MPDKEVWWDYTEWVSAPWNTDPGRKQTYTPPQEPRQCRSIGCSNVFQATSPRHYYCPSCQAKTEATVMQPETPIPIDLPPARGQSRVRTRVEYDIFDIPREVSEKWCGACKTWKAVRHFNNLKTSRDGLDRRCRSCNAESHAKSRKKNPGYNAQKRKESYLRNRERISRANKLTYGMTHRVNPRRRAGQERRRARERAED